MMEDSDLGYVLMWLFESPPRVGGIKRVTDLPGVGFGWDADGSIPHPFSMSRLLVCALLNGSGFFCPTWLSRRRA